MSKIVESQLTLYQESFLEYGDSPQGTRNQNDVIQNLRFERILKQFPTAGKAHTLHDVGCGICDLYDYIKLRQLPFEYSGTDIVPEMAGLVSEKYPEVTVSIRNLLEESTENEKYDFLCLSGTFNLPGCTPHDQWLDFCHELVVKMFAMSNCGISFNCLTGFADFYHPDMFYFDPGETHKFCHDNLSRHVIIDHAYPLYEHTVTVFKEEYLKALYPEKALEKYFKN